MRYADCFVVPVPKKNLKAYMAMSKTCSKIWLEHGALQYCECAGDDLDSKCGIPFPKAIKIKPAETVVFAWIVYKSKAHRDSVNTKVMKDPRLASWASKKMPFDMKRMICGGFTVMVDV